MMQQKGELFRFRCYLLMRRRIRQIREKQQTKTLICPSLPMLQRPETQDTSRGSQKRLALHIRQRTKLPQQQLANKTNHFPTQTPYLPKIQQTNHMTSIEQKRNGLDALQEHLHHMLLKNLKQFKENRNSKSYEQNVRKKLKNLQQTEQNNKKEDQKTRLQRLRLKLNQLYGELTLEEQKLKIEYTLEEKAQRRLDRFFNKMARRFQTNNTVDTGQNTQQPTNIKTQSQQKLSANKTKAISKFRIAAYVVYFSIIFPKYSKYFAVIRKDDFVRKATEEKAIEKSIQECYNLFEMIKIRNFMRQIPSKAIQAPLQTSSVISSQVQLIKEQFIQNFQIETVHSLLAYVLSNIFSAIKIGKLDNFIKNISIFFSNRSFIADHLFLKSQLLGIESNQQTMMKLSAGQQKMLLVNFLLIKLTAFSFMMNNSYISDNQIKYIFNKEGNNVFQNLTFSISRQLLISGIYLINLCNMLNERSKQAENLSQGNLQHQNVQNLPLPMPQIQLREKIITKEQYRQEANKRISIQNRCQQFESEYQGVYIKNTKTITQIFRNYPKDTEKKEQFLALIADIRDQIHRKVVLFKKQAYKSYSETSIKYLGQKQSNLKLYTNIYSIRSEQQQLLIRSYCNDFKTKRRSKNINNFKTNRQLEESKNADKNENPRESQQNSQYSQQN